MKKIIFVAILALGFAFTASAQYNWGVGLRGGADYGLTVKKNMGKTAIEGILASDNWGHGLRLTGLYYWQKPVIADGFNLYYGLGATLGMYGEKDMLLSLGVDGIVGLEYSFKQKFNVPISLSLDWKPTFYLINPDMNFYWKGLALSVRYIF